MDTEKTSVDYEVYEALAEDDADAGLEDVLYVDIKDLTE